MSKFTTPLLLELLPHERFRLAEGFEYHVGSYPSDEVIHVEKGFVTDLASIPRIFWPILPPHGLYGKAAVLHDWCYRHHYRTKDFADRLFLEAMTVLGVPLWKRRIMYLAVKLFGRW